MLLTQGRSQFWEAPCEDAGMGGWGEGRLRRNRGRNSITLSPHLSSPQLPHPCLTFSSPLISSCWSPRHLSSPLLHYLPLACSDLFTHLPSFVFKSHLPSFPRSRILSHLINPPPHTHPPPLHPSTHQQLLLVCLGGPISTSVCFRRTRPFKHSKTCALFGAQRRVVKTNH